MHLKFTPPTVNEAPAGPGPLFSRFVIARGETVIMNNGTFTTTRYPDLATLAAADAYWLGGYTYQVTDAQATALSLLGYGEYISFP